MEVIVSYDVHGTILLPRLPLVVERAVNESLWRNSSTLLFFRTISRRLRPNLPMIERIREHRAAHDQLFVISNTPLVLQSTLEELLGLLGAPYDEIRLPDRKYPDLVTFKLEQLPLLNIDRHYDDHWRLLGLPLVVHPPIDRVPASP